MNWEKHSVMNEFLKIAERDDLLGIKTAAAKNPYQEDLKTIEEKRLPAPDKSIVEEAHPEPVFVAESQGDGGLVENQIEQHKRFEEVINKMPNGSLVGRYASHAQMLLKLAEKCDELGNNEAADKLTDAAKQLLTKAEGFFQ